MAENVDRTMADLARKERRMNPRTRGGEEEAMRKMAKHMKSASSNGSKKEDSAKIDKKQNDDAKKKENDEEKKKAEEKLEKELKQEKMTQGKNSIFRHIVFTIRFAT